MEITVINVGYGDALLLETGEGCGCCWMAGAPWRRNLTATLTGSGPRNTWSAGASAGWTLW